MNTINPPTRNEIENALGLAPAQRKKIWVKRAIWLIAALAVLAVAYFAYQRMTQSAAVVTYDTVETETADLTVTVSATGTIQPLTQVDIGTELSGVVREVLVAENAAVKQGDVLAVLDTTRLKAQRQRAVAQGDAARARIADAKATFAERDDLVKRQKVLRSKGLSTDQDMEGALSGLLRAEASITAAEADLAANAADIAIIDADLARSRITSPIDGVVLKRDVEPGQTVAASLQAPIMFVIAQDLSRIQLEAAVDEADMGAVKTGQNASFNVDAYRGRGFPARIERLSYAPETLDGVVTYKAILSAANNDLALRPGMTATARIVVEEHPQSLVVVNEALRYQPPRVAESGSWSITQIFMPRFPRGDRGRRTASAEGTRDIYVLINGKPEKRSVKIGATDGKRTLILSGDVKAGEAIVTAQRAQAQ